MASIPQRILNKLQRIAVRRLTQFRSPLKAAVIGYGGIGPDHADAYDLCGQANVVAVSDVNPGALAAAMRRRPHVRAYLDFKHMLAETRPDVVSVCTWPSVSGTETPASLTDATFRPRIEHSPESSRPLEAEQSCCISPPCAENERMIGVPCAIWSGSGNTLAATTIARSASVTVLLCATSVGAALTGTLVASTSCGAAD